MGLFNLLFNNVSDEAAKTLKLAKQGNADAQYNLARMYFNGNGVTEDIQKALDWFQKAAEQGNTEAQNFIDLYLMFCEATIHYDRKEYDKAFSLYKQVAEGNYTELSFFVAGRLGKMYLDGKGTTKDEVQAFYWYSKLAELQAFYWYSKFAEQGNADAPCILAAMYYEGIGVTKDYQKALVWFQKAAEQGNADAQSRLGRMYYEEIGVTKDDQKALVWFQKAAEQGDADAMFHIGHMYYGENKEKEAMVWFRKAAKKGHAGAKMVVG